MTPTVHRGLDVAQIAEIREAAEYDTVVSCSPCCLRQATKILALIAEVERLRAERLALAMLSERQGACHWQWETRLRERVIAESKA